VSLPSLLAAVHVEGGEAYESRDLPAVQSAELRQRQQQRPLRHRAEARHRAQQLLLLLEVASQEVIDVVLDALDLLIQPPDVLEQARPDVWPRLVEPCLLHRPHLDQLTTANQEVCSDLLFRLLLHEEPRLHRLSEVRDDLRIDLVRLRQDAERLAEVTNLSRVADSDFEPSVEERVRRIALIAAG
jgi:hypothetical protein